MKFFLDGVFGPRFAGEMIAEKLNLLPPGIRLQTDPDDHEFVATVADSNGIGVTSSQKFLLAAWQGVPVTAFAGSLLETPTAIFALEASGIRHPQDLIDKKIGYQSGNDGGVIVDAMIAQLGLPRSRMEKVLTQNVFEALRKKSVDAVIAQIDQQPAASDSAYPRLNVIRPRDYAIHVPGLVYFARSDLLRDHPSIIAGVLGGLITGWQRAYDNYSQSVPMLLSFDPQHLKASSCEFELRSLRDLVVPIGGRIAEYDDSRWRTIRDILIFSKLGEEKVPLGTSVNYQFLRDIYRREPQ